MRQRNIYTICERRRDGREGHIRGWAKKQIKKRDETNGKKYKVMEHIQMSDNI